MFAGEGSADVEGRADVVDVDGDPLDGHDRTGHDHLFFRGGRIRERSAAVRHRVTVERILRFEKDELFSAQLDLDGRVSVTMCFLIMNRA